MPEHWVSYDNIVDAYTRYYAPRLTGPAAVLAARLPVPATPIRALDIGCGTGIATKALSERVSRRSTIVGIDVAQGMLHEAWNSGLRRLVCGTAMSLPFPDKCFDLAVSSFVLSHVPDVQTVLREIQRVVNFGGAIGITSWSESRQESELRKSWKRIAARYAPMDVLEEAMNAAVPSEAALSTPGALDSVLLGTGWKDTKVELVTDTYTVEMRDHIAEMSAWSMGRYLRATLPPSEWQQFNSEIESTLLPESSATLKVRNDFLIATAVKA